MKIYPLEETWRKHTEEDMAEALATQAPRKYLPFLTGKHPSRMGGRKFIHKAGLVEDNASRGGLGTEKTTTKQAWWKIMQPKEDWVQKIHPRSRLG
mmetsp:Transcript_24490/g.42121  ORF Transcript_24490/g.42121 Transcript_24490/m.42121 type:complete len:96 (+) Transcript_24490:19-306(+)